jgi:chromosome segregation ATPase
MVRSRRINESGEFMNSKFLLFLAAAALVCGMHSLPAYAQDDLESDFQAEDSKNLKVDAGLADQEAKATDQDLKTTEKKANKIGAENLRITQSIQNANSKVEQGKKQLEITQANIEKIQIDTVNKRKELERLNSEYSELTKQRIQARDEAIRTAQELKKVEAANKVASRRLSAAKAKKASNKSANNKRRRAKHVA